MKLVYSFLIVLFFKFNFLGSNNKCIFANLVPTDSLYITIQIIDVDLATVNKIINQVETINNCKVLIFCKNLSAFVLKFNNANNNNVNDLFERIKITTNNYNILLKEGSVKEVLNNCYLDKGAITPEIKNLLEK